MVKRDFHVWGVGGPYPARNLPVRAFEAAMIDECLFDEKRSMLWQTYRVVGANGCER